MQAQKQGSLASGVGIPHSGMGKGPFQKAVAAIGDVIELDDDTEDRYGLYRARLLVRTPLPLSIRTKVRVCVGDLEYRVWIVEETGLDGGLTRKGNSPSEGWSEEISSDDVADGIIDDGDTMSSFSPESPYRK